MAKKSAISKANKTHSSKQRRAQKPGREKGSDNLKGHGRKIQGKKMARGDKEMAEGIRKMAKGNKSKNGCAPKLFMLLLPFTIVGAYLFLTS